MERTREPVVNLKARNCFFSALFLLASAICGYFVASRIEPSIMNRLWNGDSVRWQSLGSPPGGAIRILSIGQEFNTKDIIVLTNNGKAYHCCSNNAVVWEETKKNQAQSRWGCGQLTVFPTKSPPGKVVDCAELSNWEGSTNQTIFAVLEDGTVWRWHLWVYLLDPLIILFVCGPLAGLIIGTALLWLWGRIRGAAYKRKAAQ